MTHPERVHSRAQLLDRVWGDHVFIEERTVDVHVKRLREALLPARCASMIETGARRGLPLEPTGRAHRRLIRGGDVLGLAAGRRYRRRRGLVDSGCAARLSRDALAQRRAGQRGTAHARLLG
jgi:hypothetical protein